MVGNMQMLIRRLAAGVNYPALEGGADGSRRDIPASRIVRKKGAMLPFTALNVDVALGALPRALQALLL